MPDNTLLLLAILCVEGIVICLVLIAIYLKTSATIDATKSQNFNLNLIYENIKKNSSALAEMEQALKLSEQAKSIVFHDNNMQLLRNMVFDLLENKDFDSAEQLINQIAGHPQFAQLGEQLRGQTVKFRESTNGEKIGEYICEVQKLFDSFDWIKASSEIERLIELWPQSEQIKALRQTLLDKKQRRKQQLLNQWNQAVQRKNTDLSLEILKELDLYLTPNEGLALQEAAKDVFKTKLHNLGMQFSTAVTNKCWPKALELGRIISRDFPNSKIAEEIREKMDFLLQKGAEQLL
jgi:tetratricopeptide (TPR) repeat protein